MEANGADNTAAQVLLGNANPTATARYESHLGEPCRQTAQLVQAPGARDKSNLMLATADRSHAPGNPARDTLFASCYLHHVSVFIPISRNWRRDAVKSVIDTA
ncbi:MAG: hypothetical protein F4103_14175 [Boseongicola sp. SB0673_bin_14]|nr:hypothetical protein [Boseongicola sp. SB0673_bin_14]